MSDTYQQADLDSKRGLEGLTMWHNEALKYPQNYNVTFEELVDHMQTLANGQFLSGFGFAINTVSMSDGDLRTAMINLADAGEGKLPQHWNDFFNALQAQASTFHFVEALTETTKGSIADIGSGLAQVGETVIKTAQNAAGLVTMLPYMAFAALGFFLYLEVKKRQP